MQSLTYEEYCTGHGALQRTADVIKDFGYDPLSKNPFLPNAAILRTAEAVDSIANAARSGYAAESPTVSAGYIMCTMVRMCGAAPGYV